MIRSWNHRANAGLCRRGKR